MQPHDVDPSMLKTKKQKTDNENANTSSTPTNPVTNSSAVNVLHGSRQELNKTPTKKRQSSKSPATVTSQILHSEVTSSPTALVSLLFNIKSVSNLISNILFTLQTVKDKRIHLESVLKKIKSLCVLDPTLNHEPPLDLTYLLSGRGARQRKTLSS